MPATLLSSRGLIPRDKTELGRLVLDRNEPWSDFYDPDPDFMLARHAPLIVVHENYRSVEEREEDTTATVLQQLLSRGSRKLIRVEAKRSITYNLTNVSQYFEEICALNKTQDFLESCLRKRKSAYLIVGFRTLIDANIESMVSRRSGSGIKSGVPIAGVPVPLLLGAQASVALDTSKLQSIEARGEHVYAIQFIEISFGRWVRKVESRKLSVEPVWTSVFGNESSSFYTAKAKARPPANEPRDQKRPSSDSLTAIAVPESVKESKPPIGPEIALKLDLGSRASILGDQNVTAQLRESTNVLFSPKQAPTTDTSSISSDDSILEDLRSEETSLLSTTTSSDDIPVPKMDELGKWLALRETAAACFLGDTAVGPIMKSFLARYSTGEDETTIKTQMEELIRLYGSDIRNSTSDIDKQVTGKFLIDQAKYIVNAAQRRVLRRPFGLDRNSSTLATKETQDAKAYVWTNYDMERDSTGSLTALISTGSPPLPDQFLALIVAHEQMKKLTKYMGLLTPASVVDNEVGVRAPSARESSDESSKAVLFEELADKISEKYSLRLYFREDQGSKGTWIPIPLEELDLSSPTQVVDPFRASQSHFMVKLKHLSHLSRQVFDVLRILGRNAEDDSSFRMLVRPEHRADVVSVSSISLKLLSSLDNLLQKTRTRLSLVDSENESQAFGSSLVESLLEPVGKAADAVWSYLGLFYVGTPHQRDSPTTLSSLERLHALYLALLLSSISYQWSHIGPFDEKHCGQLCEKFVIGNDRYRIYLQRERLKCLDSLLGTPVWVFGPPKPFTQGLELSAALADISDLWPPTSFSFDDEKAGHVSQIHFDNGFIFTTTNNVNEHGEIQCHYSAMHDSTTTSSIRPFEILQKLLVGSDNFLVNNACCFSNNKEPKWGTLCYLGEEGKQYKRTGKMSGWSAGMYALLNGSKTETRSPMKGLRYLTLENWKIPTANGDNEHHTRTLLKPSYLDCWTGLEISACTAHCRRKRLWDLFKEINIDFDEYECAAHEAAFSKQYESFRALWYENRVVWPGLRSIVSRVLVDLEKTGVQDGEIKAWQPPSIMARQFTVGWADMLADSMHSTTFAVVTRKCLVYPQSNPCQQGKHSAQPLLFTRLTLTARPRIRLTKKTTRKRAPTSAKSPVKLELNCTSMREKDSYEVEDNQNNVRDQSEGRSPHQFVYDEFESLDNGLQVEPDGSSRELLLRRMNSRGLLNQSRSNREADQAFQAAFPFDFEEIETTGEGMLCGLHAIQHSMREMHPTLRPPSIEEFQGICSSPGYKAKQAELGDPGELGYNNENNFFVHQLALILQLWGNSEGCRLQLGYKPTGMPPNLYPSPEVNPTIVWISHMPGHYSGLRPKPKLAQVPATNFSSEGQTVAGKNKDDTEGLPFLNPTTGNETVVLNSLAEAERELDQMSRSAVRPQAVDLPRQRYLKVERALQLLSVLQYLMYPQMSTLLFLILSLLFFQPSESNRKGAVPIDSSTISGYAGVDSADNPNSDSSAISGRRTEVEHPQDPVNMQMKRSVTPDPAEIKLPPTTPNTSDALDQPGQHTEADHSSPELGDEPLLPLNQSRDHGSSSLPASIASPDLTAPIILPRKKQNVLRFKNNSTLIIKDERAAEAWIYLSSIKEREPLLVSWKPSWKGVVPNIAIGPFSARVICKVYDRFDRYMSDDPICSEFQDEEMVGDSEQVVHVCVG